MDDWVAPERATNVLVIEAVMTVRKLMPKEHDQHGDEPSGDVLRDVVAVPDGRDRLHGPPQPSIRTSDSSRGRRWSPERRQRGVITGGGGWRSRRRRRAAWWRATARSSRFSSLFSSAIVG